MLTENKHPIEDWRWKMIRKVADYINEPDDITMSELKAMIEGYRSFHEIKKLFPDETINLGTTSFN